MCETLWEGALAKFLIVLSSEFQMCETLWEGTFIKFLIIVFAEIEMEGMVEVGVLVVVIRSKSKTTQS